MQLTRQDLYKLIKTGKHGDADKGPSIDVAESGILILMSRKLFCLTFRIINEALTCSVSCNCR